MKLIMEAWRKFAITETVNVGLNVKSDKDKEMLIGLSRASEENIRTRHQSKTSEQFIIRRHPNKA